FRVALNETGDHRMGQGQRFGRIVVLLSLAVALTSCGGGEEDAQSEAAPTQNGVGSVPEPANAAPKISGAPSKSIVAGSQYRFTPKAADSNDDVLTFKVRNKPEWANFNSRTGELSGTP